MLPFQIRRGLCLADQRECWWSVLSKDIRMIPANRRWLVATQRFGKVQQYAEGGMRKLQTHMADDSLDELDMCQRFAHLLLLAGDRFDEFGEKLRRIPQILMRLQRLILLQSLNLLPLNPANSLSERPRQLR